MAGPTPPAPSMVATDEVLALLRRIQARLLLLTVAVAVLGAGVGVLVSGTPGLLGALMAAALGLAFTLTTIATLRLVAGRDMMLLPVSLVAGWVLKMVLVVIALVWLREQDFYDRGVFFGTLVAAVVGAVVVEMSAVATARIPTVASPTAPPGATPVPGSGDGDDENRSTGA